MREGRWSAVGGDIVAEPCGRRACRPSRAASTRRLPPGISVFDAETDEDLRRVAAFGRAAPGPVLWIGAGGLAQALAGDAPAEARSPLPLPMLGLFGSDQAVTAAQLAACGADWMRLPDGGEASAKLLAGRLQSDGRALASLDLPPDLIPRRSSAAHRDRAAPPGPDACRVPERCSPLAARRCAGSACRSARAASRSRAASCPACPAPSCAAACWDGVTVVSKSGAFGHPHSAARPAAQRPHHP